MNRKTQSTALTETSQWDMVIIGGGATGLGAALDAASRGFKTLCVERYDFSKGTSSRSTKLIHGGVRYLEQGNIKMVRGALQERWFLLKNAPHMTKTIPFILPVDSWFKFFYYGIGLMFYDLLSGKLSVGSTKFLSAKSVLKDIPEIDTTNLKGGIMYYDGQFDDSMICLSLARTAISYGATVLNYCEAKDFIYTDGKISGVVLYDAIHQVNHSVNATTVINATGVFADTLLHKDDKQHVDIVAPSRGIHIVIDKSFYKGKHALLIPKTTDGRVLFAVPWHDKVVIGTTDTKISSPEVEPMPSYEEIDFVINNFNQYSTADITRKDVLSVFAGLRPLVRKQGIKSTADLLRDHTIITSTTGLITITGGKWTTYRKMAKDVIRRAIVVGGFKHKRCVTKSIQLLNSKQTQINDDTNLLLHPNHVYTYADVIHSVKEEMAFTIEDVLARRCRILFLDTKAALECAETVGKIMQKELDKNDAWLANQLEEFSSLAKQYLPTNKS